MSGIHTPPNGTVYYSDFELSNLNSKVTDSKSSNTCIYVTIEIPVPCGSGHYFRSTCRGSNVGRRWPGSYTTRESLCFNSSGGGSETKSDSPLDMENGFGGGGGGSGGGGLPAPKDTNNNSDSSANLEDMADFVEFKVNGLIKNLKLNTNQAKWVGNNIKESLDIYDYVAKENNWSIEAKDFAKIAIEALMDDDEVDFKNEIIFSKEFKQTKAYCVIKLLTNSNNNLFQDLISQFTSNNSKKMLRFLYEPLYTPSGVNDMTTEANTSPPDPLGVTTIRFNSNTNSANTNSLNIASTILHEAIHAELFRIVEGNNNVPEPLTQELYTFMTDLLDFFENNGNSQFITANAQHTFMTHNYVGAIAKAIRALDNNTHPIENYMSFGWEGLSQIGIVTQPRLVTTTEINNYYILADIPLNDNHNLSCDE